MTQVTRSRDEKEAIVAYAAEHGQLAAAEKYGCWPQQVSKWKQGHDLGQIGIRAGINPGNPELAARLKALSWPELLTYVDRVLMAEAS